ncbi:hypothetical protein [Paraglaciecola sp. L3A3]|uniref:hypothetical protein n=1 Tax=Paraglaciecola sp. L3A3 TaxID=2686358 RepID=UPI0018EF1AF7|nr:hypothetical protein [Paraglaciecola sp. L3A3]
MNIELWKGSNDQPKQDRFLASLNYSHGLLTAQIEYRKLDQSYLIAFRTPHYFRVMDEGDLLKFQSQFDTPVFADGFIYQAYDSELINYCFNEKHEIFEKDKFNHFILVTDDEFIDVITYDDQPTIVAIDV